MSKVERVLQRYQVRYAVHWPEGQTVLNNKINILNNSQI